MYPVSTLLHFFVGSFVSLPTSHLDPYVLGSYPIRNQCIMRLHQFNRFYSTFDDITKSWLKALMK